MDGATYFFCIYCKCSFVIRGGLGIWIADWCEDTLLVKEQLAFPIGQPVYKTIAAMSNQMRKAYELIVGFVGTMIFCMLQDGVMRIQSLFPKSVMMVNAMKVGFITIPTINYFVPTGMGNRFCYGTCDRIAIGSGGDFTHIIFGSIA